MALFRLPRLREVASTTIGNLRDRFGRKPGRGAVDRSYRRLLVDPLEERMLLSVAPAEVEQALITGSDPAYNVGNPQHSVAVDNDGDFVVVWTRFDDVFDEHGDPLIDLETGYPMVDSNIFARYFTDEVQRITLPEAAAENNLPGSYGTFSLRYGGNEVQKLSITPTYQPFLPDIFQSRMVGQFTLIFDVDGNGLPGDGANERITFFYDESSPPEDNAADLQTAFQGMGGALSDVDVTALSPQEYMIKFGDASMGEDQPDIIVESFDFSSNIFYSGFYPAVVASTISEPGEIQNIPISPDDPNLTAFGIEQFFRQTMEETRMAPIDFPPPDQLPHFLGPRIELFPIEPDFIRTPNPDISVTAISTTEFDIRFVGDSGKKDHPELVVTAVEDDLGNSLIASPEIEVRTLKQSSPEFRVNAEEPDNPFTPQPDFTDEAHPAVAMDADGDFVITWQSDVNDYDNPGSVIDIFARRFSPVGMVDPADVEFVQSVRALGDPFLVNTFTTGEQTFPDVGMDNDGNFIIAWQNEAQGLSFFNGIAAQRFNRDGERVGNSYMVNTEDTAVYIEPYVAMSDDGHSLITWARTNSPGVVNGAGIVVGTWAEVYDPDGNVLISEFPVMGGGDPTAAFDAANNFVITVDAVFDNDLGGALGSNGTHAQMHRLYNPDGSVSGELIRNEFRANSASFVADSVPLWPHFQGWGQVGLDVDGDMVIGYSGYGPDTAEMPLGMLPPRDIDEFIDSQIIAAINAGMSDQEIGLLRVQLEETYGYLRGQADAVMYSRWDADPQIGVSNILYSDNVVNSVRDGHNHRSIISINQAIDGGSFTVRLWRGGVAGFEDIQIDPVFSDGDPAVLLPIPTADAIEAALEAANRTGEGWRPYNNPYAGPIWVRIIPAGEVMQRSGTPYDLMLTETDYIFEITYIGTSHDWWFDLALAPDGNDLTIGGDPGPPPTIFTHTHGDYGNLREFAGMGMEPDGDFVIVWTRYEELTDAWFVNSDIYYRQFDQDKDNAGPNVTDFLLPDGERLDDGAQVTENLQHIVVSFDEALMTDQSEHAVTDTRNWALMRDGVEVLGGISEVQFGMSMSTTFGLTSVGSNKWEAVLVLDGNGQSAGTPTLEEGNYEIVAKHSLRDVVGNALGRSGFAVNGGPISRTFYVTLPTGCEIPINTGTAGDQISVEPAIDAGVFPNSPNAVAGDADGDFVSVWTSDGPQPGVYAGLYNVLWSNTPSGRSSAVTKLDEIQVTDDPTATYASVARDADGDFVVTWSAYSPLTSWDVHFRRFDALGRPLGDPDRVNSDTDDIQRFSTVAMDLDGDFVVTWQSQTQDGSGYGVYAQRYNRAGEPLDGTNEVQFVRFTGEVDMITFALRFGDSGSVTGPIVYQPGDDPEQAMQDVADAIELEFVALGIEVETEVLGQSDIAIEFVGDFGRWDQPPIRIDFATIAGEAGADISVGTSVEGATSEIRVNEDTSLGDQQFPAVAMDTSGNFVIAWTSFGQGTDAAYQTNIIGKRYIWIEAAGGVPGTFLVGTPEFFVNQTQDDDQKWSAVAMDADGDFVVTWTSYGQDGVGNAYGPGINGENGVYARRFTADATMASAEFLVNTFAANNQQHARVAMDADGDFMVAWESFQDRPAPGGGPDTANSYGIYAQRYARADQIGVDPFVGPNGEIGSELRVHSTMAGDQRFPAITLSDTGDAVIAWSGNGPGDDQGIFAQRFERPEDDAGPMVTDVDNVNEPPGEPVIFQEVFEGVILTSEVTRFVVTFGEDLNTEFAEAGPRSVLNTDNWLLTRNGSLLPGAVSEIEFGLNQAFVLGLAGATSNKYEAVLTFDSDYTEAGDQPLGDGLYELTARTQIEDLFGNDLDGNANGLKDGSPGDDFRRTFVIRIGAEGGDNPVIPPCPPVCIINGRTYPETPGAVAVDADGDYVVAWTGYDLTLDADRVYVGMFNANGTSAITPFALTDPTADPEFADDVQRYASVAIDADGDFIVTWTNYRDADGNPANGREEQDVYARRYHASGIPMGNDAFRVNTYTTNNQKWSNVAMDVDGDFVVTWSSYGQEDNNQLGFGYGVYARRYDSFGCPYAPEFQVNTTITGNQQFSSVAMDAAGGFVVAWTSDQNGIGDDIVARVYNPDGSPTDGVLTGEFMVNDTLEGNQRYPDVATSLSGDSYAITWSSSQQTDDQSGFGIYTKLYNRIGAAQQRVRYIYEGLPVDFADLSTIDVPIQVDDSFLINDLDVRVNISHQDPSDLRVTLISPSGTEVLLFDEVPRQGDAFGYTEGGTNGIDFRGTLLDDQADISIIDNVAGALPPFDDVYRSEELLSTFNNENAQGAWILRVQDVDPQADPDFEYDVDGNRVRVLDGGRVRSWSLDFLRDPAASNETLVNSTVEGNQIYSSVAMDHGGGLVVVWSGVGNQPDQEDTSEYGVFAQRFNAALGRVGGETRLNSQTGGMQWIPSVGADGEGNFVAAWTGLGTSSSSATDVYAYVSANTSPQEDIDGPIVTGVLLEDDSRLLEGGVVIDATLTSLTVVFGEDLSTQVEPVDGSVLPTLDSVLNTNNWVLERNGTEILGGVTNVGFQYNAGSRQYEATLALDGNGISVGEVPLEPGDYVLTVRDQVRDVFGNNLDGNFDGVAGTAPSDTGYDGYKFRFAVADGPRLGAEYRINENPTFEQRFAESWGTGFARENTTRSVAVDHDGDYVVVWTSYGQDDPDDPAGGGVYFRMFNRDDAPLTPERPVNRYTQGHQRNATVAMDADGDFIIVWEAEGQGGDESWDIFAQPFNAAGQRIATPLDCIYRLPNDPATDPLDEVLVNHDTTGDQVNPAAAMDAFGNAVVVWSTGGQPFSFFNDVHAQLFDYLGRPTGEEFRVNSAVAAGADPTAPADGQQINPAVAMDAMGNFVVSWDEVSAQQNGVPIDSNVIARLFDRLGTPLGNEIVVDAGDNSRNSQISMDPEGNFVVAWEAVGDDFDIFYQRYAADGSSLGGVQQVNMLPGDDGTDEVGINDLFELDQVNPSIAIDADGDVVVTFNGNGAQPDPLDLANQDLVGDEDSAGVFGRWFDSSDEPVSVQQRVNRTAAGIQQFPTIAMEPDGDAIVVWNGAGVGDRHGIFARRYDELTDTAGPLATELRMDDADHTLVADGDSVFVNPDRVLVVFDEQMSTAGGTSGEHSVLNPNNWALISADNQELQGTIREVQFAFNAQLNKWTAIIYFRGLPGSGNNDLPNASYTLIARSTLHDASGNPLARSGYRPEGAGVLPDGTDPTDPITSPTGGMGFRFRIHNTLPGSPTDGDTDPQVNTTDAGDQNSSAIARNADGDYVVVWVNYTPIEDEGDEDDQEDEDEDEDEEPDRGDTEDATVQADIMAQRFDFWGRALGDEFLVNSITTGDQVEPDVAIDNEGNFIVVWSGDGELIGDDSGVFAQRFDAKGDAIGGQFRVNQYTEYSQDEPAVTMTAAGDFVIVWTSFAQDGSRDGVYARRFNAFGQPLGNEFRVNTTTAHSQRTPDVAASSTGSFVVTWASDSQDADDWGVFAQRYNAAGGRAGGEFRVNDHQNDEQIDPQVAMDAAGNFIVTWASYLQDGSGFGVYAKRYNMAGTVQGGEFRVNQTTTHWQHSPDVAISAGKGFVVTWTSFNQDNPQDADIRDDGIFARLYNPNGTDFIDSQTGDPLGEFRVNAFTEGDQFESAVSMDGIGHFVVTWAGADFFVEEPTDEDEDDQEDEDEDEEPDRGGDEETQTTAIFSRLLDPPVDSQDVIIYADVRLAGTPGNDLFEFVGGPTSNSWIVKVNSQIQYIGENVNEIYFDGHTGYDTVLITGTGADETLALWPDRGTFGDGSYTLDLSNMEDVTVVGGGGADVAYLHDSAGDDTFVTQPGDAELTGSGFSLSVQSFPYVHGFADAGGNDTAMLYDSNGADTFTTYPTYVEMAGQQFYAKAHGFEAAKGYAESGGDDVAEMYDSPGNDTFVTTPDYSKFYGDGFYTMAVAFPTAKGYATAGGTDVAIMNGSPGSDTFVGTPTYAKFFGEGFYNRADYFEVVKAYGQVGGDDTASLYGSEGDDTFIAGPQYGKMFGEGYSIRSDNFRYVTGYGNTGGTDVANLYDSAGDDILVVTPIYGKLYGQTYFNRAYAFDTVNAWATAGGHDEAQLHDSALNDYLEAEDDWVRLSNAQAEFSYWLAGFERVTATSSNSGDIKNIAPAVDFLITQGLWEDE